MQIRDNISARPSVYFSLLISVVFLPNFFSSNIQKYPEIIHVCFYPHFQGKTWTRLKATGLSRRPIQSFQHVPRGKRIKWPFIIRGFCFYI
jgi:hypothetical protein